MEETQWHVYSTRPRCSASLLSNCICSLSAVSQYHWAALSTKDNTSKSSKTSPLLLKRLTDHHLPRCAFKQWDRNVSLSQRNPTERTQSDVEEQRAKQSRLGSPHPPAHYPSPFRATVLGSLMTCCFGGTRGKKKQKNKSLAVTCCNSSAEHR